MNKGLVTEIQAAHPDAELQTDKATGKIVVCTIADCECEIIANVFYAPAKARCSAHGGGMGTERARTGSASVASIGVVQAGKTDPAKAVNLADCLINKALAEAYCPFDPTHDMELKSVTHNPNYGPSRRVGTNKDGTPLYKNDTGEVVVHQCNECKTLVSISTTAQHVYARMNEPKPNAGVEPKPILLRPREVAGSGRREARLRAERKERARQAVAWVLNHHPVHDVALVEATMNIGSARARDLRAAYRTGGADGLRQWADMEGLL